MLAIATIAICMTVIFVFPTEIRIGQTSSYKFWWQDTVLGSLLKSRPTTVQSVSLSNEEKNDGK